MSRKRFPSLIVMAVLFLLLSIGIFFPVIARACAGPGQAPSGTATPQGSSFPVMTPVSTFPAIPLANRKDSTLPAQPNDQTTEAGMAVVVFQAINTARTQNNLPLLTWSNTLTGGAHAHNLLMAQAQLTFHDGKIHLSHQLANEPGILPRIHQESPPWPFNPVAENIAASSDMSINGPMLNHNDMMAEQPPKNGHRANMLFPHYTNPPEILVQGYVGIDVYLDTQNHIAWLTEDFAFQTR